MASDRKIARITSELKAAASRLGFELTGACPAVPAHGFQHFQQWLARGFAGEMRYLPDREAAYLHPDSILEGVRSLLMLAMPYRTDDPRSAGPGQGRISRYAWGAADYHDVIHVRLKALAQTARSVAPGVQVRGVTDTAPLLERDFAQLAGLGWIGKNTMLINPNQGSWFFLAALLLDCELEYDTQVVANHCGTCTACLDACPTKAFPQPYVLDATRCISYLTIELRDVIPGEFRTKMHDWVFGCDVCQEVCPWNSKSSVTDELAFAAVEANNPVDLLALFEMDDQQFRDRFRRTPLWRTRRRGILRNAAIALGNHASEHAVPALLCGLHDQDSLVRGASAWALGRIGTSRARHALQQRMEVEDDEQVIEELQAVLSS